MSQSLGASKRSVRQSVLSGLRGFFGQQSRLSRAVERQLPEEVWRDGHADFLRNLLPQYLPENGNVYDVGAGRNPGIDAETKQRLGITLVGLDIDAEELDTAPHGAYDRTIVADLTTFRGDGDGDLVLLSAVLEHVRNIEGAFLGLASLCRPGGKIVLWVPCRNAAYARANLLMPEGLKRKILGVVYGYPPEKDGFPAFYRRCTPKDFRQLAEASGLRVEVERLYWGNSYFYPLLPLYLLWRGWVLLFRAVNRPQSAESFSMVLVKPAA